ncbi:MAG: sigma-54-dependent Fis family transcriptional regulator [Candidatus Hydrogenedentes bacterium]|nr:sigma-54-dependent Fis family transcriptional regulator [Candidatus Hydrogenedentota bacterium]
MPPLRVLVVEDEHRLRANIVGCLEGYGYLVTAVSNAEDALVAVSKLDIDVVFLDVYLSNANGEEYILPLLSEKPGLGIVVMTAYPTIEGAVGAVRKGACDYLEKPFTADTLAKAAARAGAAASVRSRANGNGTSGAPEGGSVQWPSASAAMKAVLNRALQVAASGAPVLLRGEHGTGKTLLARAIHEWSSRRDRALGIVSCPSLSAQLLESELFGHVRGAFTGAVKDNPGRVAQCDGGTLFLDEIGDLPVELQPKLLRFLQDKEYEPVGDARTRHADVRIISATNADIEQAVSRGRLREDLLYRLNVVELRVPPLRERKEDIPDLARQLLQSLAKGASRPVAGFTPEAERALTEYAWPGNVRELRNAIERALVFCTNGHIGAEHLPGGQIAPPDEPRVGDPVSLATLQEHHIRRVLASTRSLREAATILEIDETTLWRRRKEYGL